MTRRLWRDIADQLREQSFALGIVVGLAIALLLMVVGSWMHGLAVVDLTGGAR